VKTLGRILIILGVAILIAGGTLAFMQSDLALKIFPELSGPMRGGWSRHSRFGSEFSFQLALLGIFKNLSVIALFVTVVVLFQHSSIEKKRINKKRKSRN